MEEVLGSAHTQGEEIVQQCDYQVGFMEPLKSLFSIPHNKAICSIVTMLKNKQSFNCWVIITKSLLSLYLEIKTFSAFYEVKQAHFLSDQNLGSRTWS